MSIPEGMVIVSGAPVLSVLIWLVVSVLVLYLARRYAHQAIAGLCRVLHNAFRLATRSVMLAERSLVLRNREVLLAAGREAAESIIEREFERVDDVVRRDLAEYPALQRQLSELIQRIDEEFQNSSEVPPTPPAWVRAVEAIAKIPTKDPMVATVLEDIHESMKRAQVAATEEFRTSSRKRHQILQKMMPQWRSIISILGGVDKNVNRLLERSVKIDRHIANYEEILRGSDRAQRMLSSSSLTQFFIAGFVLVIAVGGALINFNLIARPMQEMVGGSQYIMGFKVANIAALVIILVEISMGLLLMECLRITRLFPVISALDDRIRVRMGWIFFSILCVLATIEAGLAYMREILYQDDAALIASLVTEAAAQAEANAHQWITTAAQMSMGFILPFALIFVAIPLESFVHASRTVMGVLAVLALRVSAFVLRLLGNLFHHLGSMLVRLYDLLIFAPLWLEQRVAEGRRPAPAPKTQVEKGEKAAPKGLDTEKEQRVSLPQIMEG